MTQAEKIAKILEALKELEDALFSNDRSAQLEHARKAREMRETIAN